MSKVGILTLYYKNYNYGGMLQAYALQKTIPNSKQISYILDSGYKNWNPIKEAVKAPLRKVYHKAKYGKWAKEAEKRIQLFDSFSETIPHTKVVTADSISNLCDDFDLFICGSDQIWNPIGWQPQLFFSFLPEGKKRISYAASISRDSLTKNELEFIGKYIFKFSAVSVREKQAENLLSANFSGLPIQTVPDPVFLLDKEDWREISKDSTFSENENFIFAYFLGEDKKNRNLAIQYAKKLNKKILFIGNMNTKDIEWEENNSQFMAPPMGPLDFLWAIDNADIVLTDSFHAAAFASILETPFYALPRFKKGEKGSMNSRLENLVSVLGVENRFTESLMSKDYAYNESELCNIRRNTADQRRIGLSFLSKHII